MNKVSEFRKKEWRNQIEVILNEIEISELILTEWENEFIDSVDIQLLGEKELSFKQSSVLRKIYNRITS